MCARCGCDPPRERHSSGDITLDDVEQAGDNHGLNAEQVAEDIQKTVQREAE
ncbi:MAG TPA: hypothetical protein VNN74_00465 [Candidatus Micrarchaeia archaeon]|nr:hypothetical protein [Candidatus Micrarchaeia archaeon]